MEGYLGSHQNLRCLKLSLRSPEKTRSDNGTSRTLGALLLSLVLAGCSAVAPQIAKQQQPKPVPPGSLLCDSAVAPQLTKDIRDLDLQLAEALREPEASKLSPLVNSGLQQLLKNPKQLGGCYGQVYPKEKPRQLLRIWHAQGTNSSPKTRWILKDAAHPSETLIVPAAPELVITQLELPHSHASYCLWATHEKEGGSWKVATFGRLLVSLNGRTLPEQLADIQATLKEGNQLEALFRLEVVAGQLQVWESVGFKLPEASKAQAQLQKLREAVAGSLRSYQVAGKVITFERVGATIHPDGPQWIVPKFFYSSKDEVDQATIEAFHRELRKEPILSESLSFPEVHYSLAAPKKGKGFSTMCVSWLSGKVKSLAPPGPYSNQF